MIVSGDPAQFAVENFDFEWMNDLLEMDDARMTVLPGMNHQLILLKSVHQYAMYVTQYLVGNSNLQVLETARHDHVSISSLAVLLVE